MVPERIASLFRRRRIRSVEELEAFIRAEATHVAQVSLLSYLRARMGTRWPAHFQDPAFAPAIERAQHAGYLICAADLAVFASAELRLGADAARRLFRSAGGKADVAFNERLSGHDWAAPSETAFQPSARDLIGAAPVVDAFREEDHQAFANALALRWAEVRRKFRAAVDPTMLTRAVSQGASRWDG